MSEENVVHVLGLSGGKDSSALALYMKEQYPDMDIKYFFTDTGYELPETMEFLDKLEAKLGKIERLNFKSLNGISGRGSLDFHQLLVQKGHYLPSPSKRWCTAEMKLKPFLNWVDGFLADGYKVKNYVGIRADEPDRVGLEATGGKDVESIFPFREDGISKPEILPILERNGMEMPEYYKWRSRSGCTFCFYQQKIEWLNLKEKHPDLFEQAKEFEMGEDNVVDGDRFYWLGKGEPLSTLEDPEKAQKIRDNHAKKLEKFNSKRRPNALLGQNFALEVEDIDAMYGGGKGCATCYK